MTEATMRSLNAGFRFVLELLVLLALLLFGLGASDDLIIGLPIAIVLVGIVVAIWGLLFSQRIVAITLPPKAGLVCRRLPLSSMSRPVQSAVSPVLILTASLGARDLPRLLAPRRKMLG